MAGTKRIGARGQAEATREPLSRAPRGRRGREREGQGRPHIPPLGVLVRSRRDRAVPPGPRGGSECAGDGLRPDPFRDVRLGRLPEQPVDCELSSSSCSASTPRRPHSRVSSGSRPMIPCACGRRRSSGTASIIPSSSWRRTARRSKVMPSRFPHTTTQQEVINMRKNIAVDPYQIIS